MNPRNLATLIMATRVHEDADDPHQAARYLAAQLTGRDDEFKQRKEELLEESLDIEAVAPLIGLTEDTASERIPNLQDMWHEDLRPATIEATQGVLALAMVDKSWMGTAKRLVNTVAVADMVVEAVEDRDEPGT